MQGGTAITPVCLPVCVPADGNSGIFQHGSSPVWPITSEDERRVLEKLAAAYGAGLGYISAIPGTSTVRRSGTVAGLGDMARNSAKLYAHLTGRTVTWAATNEILMGMDVPSVVVCNPEDLDPRTMDWLYSEHHSSAPGLVCGLTAEEMHREVLVRSAVLHLQSLGSDPRRVRRRGVSFHPDSPFDQIEVGPITFLGGKASSDSVRRSLSLGAGVLSLHAHSDGVDTNLGQQVLCPLQPASLGVETKQGPHCRVTGYCHRKKMPVATFLESPSSAPPDLITAHVLVLSVCWGIACSWNSHYDYSVSMLRAILERGTVGAVLCTWESSFSVGSDGESMVHRLLGGDTAGGVANWLNGQPASKARAVQFCIIGDPLVALAGEQTAIPKIAPAPIPSYRGHSAALGFLRLFVHHDTEGLDQKKEAARVLAATAISDYERAWYTSKRSTLEGLASLVREHVTAFVAARGPMPSHAWLRCPSNHEAGARNGTCAMCNAASRSLRFHLDAPGDVVRVLDVCVRCGTTADLGDADCDLRLATDGVQLQLRGSLPKSEWSALAAIYTRTADSKRVTRRWPADADGRPKRSLALPSLLSGGLYEIGVVVMHHLDLHVLRGQLRASQVSLSSKTKQAKSLWVSESE